MKLEPPFRRATSKDVRRIAELFRIASDGVAEYVWSTLAPEYPGLAPLEIGVQRYAREDNPFGFKNCVIAERGGDVLGMLVTFPIAQPAPAGEGGGWSNRRQRSRSRARPLRQAGKTGDVVRLCDGRLPPVPPPGSR